MLEKDAYVAVCEFLKKNVLQGCTPNNIQKQLQSIVKSEPVDLLTVSQQLKRQWEN